MAKGPREGPDRGKRYEKKAKPVPPHPILDARLTRRGALRLGAGALAINAVEYVGDKVHSNTPSDTLNEGARRQSIKEMETPGAKYRIEYGDHTQLSTPEILNEADALVLEYTGDWGTENDATGHVHTMSELPPPGSKNVRPYAALVSAALRRGTPIFLIDVNDKGTDSSQVGPFLKRIEENYGFATSAKRVEIALGGAMMVHLGLQPPPPRGYTRRELLQQGGEAAAALYLLTNSPEQLATMSYTLPGTSGSPNEQSLIRAAERKFRALNETVHPELRTLAVEGRNDFLGQKSETVAKLVAARLGRKPTLAVEIGAVHTGYERALVRPEVERVRNIVSDFGKNLRGQSKIVRIDVEPFSGQTPPKLVVTFYDDAAIKAAEERK